MRLLLIHSDFIEYEVTKKAGKFAEDISEDRRKGGLEDALAAFIAVESGDEADPAGAVAKGAEEIRKVAQMVKTSRVMLYPYAHLSEDLGKPAVAVKVLEDLETELSEFETKRSPFGWYKAFKLSCKGHPLSELSRHVLPDGAGASTSTSTPTTSTAAPTQQAKKETGAATVSQALKAEEGLKSTWYVLTPEGELVEAEEFNFKQHPGLRRFYEHEAKGSRKVTQEPPHIKTMQDLELVDYESGSDPGNFRWYPKGQMIKRLMEQHVSDICRQQGAMQVETPIMYDYQHPALSKYLQRFPARQYVVKSEDKDFFLRFAACFGQYLIAHDATISYRQLPLRLYELTHYSFRREQRGELAGLRRLRSFTMPDMHTLVADLDQGKQEFLRQFEHSMRWMKDLEFEYEAGVRFVRDFFEANRDFAVTLAKTLGRPILIEMWEERFFYFTMKFEFNVNDASGKAAALSTVQIDVENAERFEIEYTDKDGKRKHPYILHASVSGSIDRCLYAMLESQLADKQKKPSLPFWLSPTQIRVLPVTDDHQEACLQLAQSMRTRAEGQGVQLRIDIDDRAEGIGRKIRDAEKDWVGVILVVGDKEKESRRFQPRLRTKALQDAVGDTQEGIEEDRLVDALVGLVKGYPMAPLPLPERLTLRPQFR
jgi:threonyl-tRNA synthetase